MPVSPVDQFLQAFHDQVSTGLGLISPAVFGFFDFLMVMGVCLMLSMLMLGGQSYWVPLARKAIYLGAMGWIVSSAPMLSNAIMESFISLGLTAGGSGMSPDDFMRPGVISEWGQQIADQMFTAANKLTGIWATLENIDMIGTLLFTALLVMLAYDLMALAVFVAVILFEIGVLVAFVLAALSAWRGTAWAASGAFGFVLSSGVRLMTYAAIASMAGAMISNVVVSDSPTMSEVYYLWMLAAVIMGLALFGGVVAGSVMTGAANMGLGTALGSAVAATAAVAAPVLAGRAIGRDGFAATQRIAGRSAAEATPALPAPARGVGPSAAQVSTQAKPQVGTRAAVPLQAPTTRPIPHLQQAISTGRAVVPDGMDNGGGMQAPPDLER